MHIIAEKPLLFSLVNPTVLIFSIIFLGLYFRVENRLLQTIIVTATTVHYFSQTPFSVS